MTVDISQGVELLDRVMPGWALSINTNSLEMSSCTDCVIGQLCGEYTIEKLCPNVPLTEREKLGFDFGFDLEYIPYLYPNYQTRHQHWDMLRDAWIDVIRERQVQALAVQHEQELVTA